MASAHGRGFLGEVLAALGLDPAAGLEVLPAAGLAGRPPSGDLPALILCGAVAGPDQVARHLQGVYPHTHPVTLVRAGDNGRLVLAPVPLRDLPRHAGADLAALYLASVAPPAPRRHPLDPLVQVMARLRGPGGCPWDREQTHASLRPYMLEEAYEAVAAMGAGDMTHLCEELGDVLLQVVFHAQLARERGDFSIDEVVTGITTKLIRRHPHVFGDVQVSGAADVVRNWEAIKAQEQGQAPGGLLAGVGEGLPALTRALKVQRKAARVGFDWPDVRGPLEKVREELAELETAGPGAAEAELGDLLFAVVNVARFYGVDPEVALAGAVARFQRRFAHMEAGARAVNLKLEEMTPEEMDRLWVEAKNAEK